MRPSVVERVPGAEWLLNVRGRAAPRWKRNGHGHSGRAQLDERASALERSMAKLQGKVVLTLTAEQAALVQGLLAGAGVAAPKAAKGKAKPSKAAEMFKTRGHICQDCGKGFKTAGRYNGTGDWSGLLGHRVTAHGAKS